jgi:hypothetical protein
MNTNPTSIYTDLRQSLCEVRLLNLPSSTLGTGLIYGALEHVLLDSQPRPPYVALSYMWGDASQKKPIFLNGVEVDVTVSLHGFLQALDRSTTPQSQSHLRDFSAYPFWIDAICINQNNEPEKVHQINMMRHIYQSAYKTLIWLGEAAEESDMAFEWLELLSHIHIKDLQRISSEEKDKLWNDRAWIAFCSLLERLYFRRRWIIQEAVVSERLYVACGNKVLRWDQFETAAEHAAGILLEDRSARSISTLVTDVEPMMSIGKLRRRLAEKGNATSTNMLELLTRFRRCASSNPHDRIYSFLGLCSEKEALGNPINYSYPIEDVFMKVVISHIRVFHNLDFLNTCTQAARTLHRIDNTAYWLGDVKILPDNPNWARMIELPHLPTWTPNWTSYHIDWRLGPMSLDATNDFTPLFNACGSTKCLVRNLDSAINERVLRVDGVEIDHVARIHHKTPVPHPDQKNPNSNIFPSLWDFCSSLSISSSPYGSEVNRLMAYFRTLTAGGLPPYTRSFVTDRFLRYWYTQFFRNDHRFQLQVSKLLQPRDYTKPAPEEWYETSDRGLGLTHAESLGLLCPVMSFDQLCAFKVFITQRGWIGLGPPRREVGDKVCVLFGCSSPLVLYSDPTNPRGLCVRGEAYIHGWMFGEALEKIRLGELETSIFDLV